MLLFMEFVDPSKIFCLFCDPDPDPDPTILLMKHVFADNQASLIVLTVHNILL